MRCLCSLRPEADILLCRISTNRGPQFEFSNTRFSSLPICFADAFARTRRCQRRASLGCIKARGQSYLVAPHSRRHQRRHRASRARELRRGSKPFVTRCGAGQAHWRNLPCARHCSRGRFDQSLLPLHRHRHACVWPRDSGFISQATGHRIRRSGQTKSGTCCARNS